MRPAVVWFGETLPQDIWSQAEVVCMEIDCLLVIGTSATVYPAFSLVELAAGQGSQIIVVNTEAIDSNQGALIEISGKAGDILPKLLD